MHPASEENLPADKSGRHAYARTGTGRSRCGQPGDRLPVYGKAGWIFCRPGYRGQIFPGCRHDNSEHHQSRRDGWFHPHVREEPIHSTASLCPCPPGEAPCVCCHDCPVRHIPVVSIPYTESAYPPLLHLSIPSSRHDSLRLRRRHRSQAFRCDGLMHWWLPDSYRHAGRSGEAVLAHQMRQAGEVV